MVSFADLVQAQPTQTLAKLAEFLGISKGQVTQLLEEGQLEGTILATLRLRGVAATPNLKNFSADVGANDKSSARRRSFSIDRRDAGSVRYHDYDHVHRRGGVQLYDGAPGRSRG